VTIWRIDGCTVEVSPAPALLNDRITFPVASRMSSVTGALGARASQ
jgi:hypothetical protein